MIVDSHVHVVSADVERYPLRPSGVGSDWFRTAPADVTRLVTETRRAGVDRAVLVQAFGAYSTDNSYVLDAAAATRQPCVVVVDGADDLRRLVAERGDVVRGVRVFAIAGAGPVDDAALWSAAASLGLPVVVATLADGLPALAAMLRRFPGVEVALDHCGFPDLAGGPPFAAAAPLLDLAGFANLHLKVTPHVLAPAGDGRDVVDRLADVFSADRLLWGSDYPQTHDRPYADLVGLARHAASRLDTAAREAFLGGTAERLWPSL